MSWTPEGAAIQRLEQRLTNDQLLKLMREADHVGIDAPFGWPRSFQDAVAHWSNRGRWTVPWPDEEALRSLRLRETDRWIRGRLNKEPLSVSSSGIAVTAWRAAALLTAAGEADHLPLDRVYGRVREVYPGAALLAWKLIELGSAESYKSSAAAREQLIARMAPDGGWLKLTPPQQQDLIRSDHKLDALIGALVSRAAAANLTEHPPASLDEQLISTEGWIAHPTDSSWDRLPLPT